MNTLFLILYVYILSYCCIISISSSSKLLNNNQEEPILTKLARKKQLPNNRIWLPEYDRHIKNFIEVNTLDEQDAILFEYIFNNTFSSIQKTIRFTSNFIKISTNTLAGIISGIIKSTGGICNFIANLFWIISSKLENIIYINDEFRIRSSKAMNNTAKVLYTIGNTFIWSGEIIESMTVGLSDALVDSFKSLEFMSTSSNDIVKVLLQSKHATKYHMSCNDSILRVDDDVLNLSSCDSNQSIARNHHYQKIGMNSLSAYSTVASNSFQELLIHQLHVVEDNSIHLQHNRMQVGKVNIDSNQTNTNSMNENSFFNVSYYTNLWPFNTSSSTLCDYFVHHSALRFCTTLGIDGLIGNTVYLSARVMNLMFVLWEQQMDAMVMLYSSSDSCSTSSSDSISSSSRYDDDDGSGDNVVIPSQGIFFIVSLVITFIIATLPAASIRIRIALFLLLTNILYVCFLSVENIQRARIKLHTQIQSKHDLLSHQVKQHEYSAAHTTTDNLIAAATYHQSPSSYNKNQQSPPPSSESTIWLNIILTELWQVLNKDSVKTGGLGPYVNEMYADMFKTELSKVPPGVANIRLKQFDLGSSAPLLNGVHVRTERNLQCRKMFGIQYKNNLTAKQMKQYIKKYRSDTAAASHHPNEYYYHLYNNSNTTTTTNQSFLHNSDDTPFYHSNDDKQYSSPISSFLLYFTYFQNGKLGSLANWIQQNLFDHRTNTNYTTSTNDTKSASDSSKEKLLLHLLHQQFSSECDRLIIDLDMIYASKDMQVVLSLRSNDLQSLVPEVTVRLSELNINGHLILNASLTDDYPFLGITQIQFRETPRLDFSLSGFGGIELSAVPYAFYWVNASIYWILDQYTAPFSTALDLRHIICPSCDLLEKKPKNVLDSILQSIHASQLLNRTILHVHNQTNKASHAIHNIHQELQRKFPIIKLSKYFYHHIKSKSSNLTLLSKQSSVSSYLNSVFHILLNHSVSGSIPWVMSSEIYHTFTSSSSSKGNEKWNHNSQYYTPSSSYNTKIKKEQAAPHSYSSTILHPDDDHYKNEQRIHTSSDPSTTHLHYNNCNNSNICSSSSINMKQQANKYIATAMHLYYQHYVIDQLNDIIFYLQRQITERFVPNL